MRPPFARSVISASICTPRASAATSASRTPKSSQRNSDSISRDRAEAITSHEAKRFSDWQASRDVVPAIASLRERAESIRSSELAKAQSRLEGLSESERRTVESLTTQIVNKLLHVPIVRMKEAAVAEGSGYVEVARHLFGLADDDGADPGRQPRK